jgi:hypothetical protein
MHTKYSQVDSFFVKEIMQIKCSSVQVQNCSKCDPLIIFKKKIRLETMFPIWKLFLETKIQTYYQHIIFNIRGSFLLKNHSSLGKK